ncbi:uncharacterized protein BX663DRAFT_429897 [Cokeromyces recurvatus]|uniref:uncharacterized protein n=1 Tax=Cokeromyces recurvatus TaxID=90255 RepID=UPI00222100C5|nr:uncharacterized protein BX663DRAFT_429897 [Cokeromyces recurvatus]KAI7905543.1 hypothetical protein BX663DRAFT_429897 [Cokeromyces recurvatus]
MNETSSLKWPIEASPTLGDTGFIYSHSPEPEMAMIHTPPTPPMSLSHSPSTSSSSFSLNSEHNLRTSPQPEVIAPANTLQSTKSVKQEKEDESKIIKTTSVHSGRKRRIVFEGDDAEERRKKFLERNRVAAYKCRQKKKNWMQELEHKAEIQNAYNEELRALVAQLKEESMYLRNLLLTHGNCNCESVQAYLRKTSAEITNNVVPTNANNDLSYSRRSSLVSGSNIPYHPTSFKSNTMPSFSETSTGLTPFLNTVINKSQPNDYFSQNHTNES